MSNADDERRRDPNAKAEARLRDQESLLLATELSPDAVFIADQNGDYLYVNQASIALLGYSFDELTAMNVADLSSPEAATADSLLFSSLLETGELVTELTLVHKDGAEVSVALNATLLTNGLIYGSCRDITEQRRARERLRISEERFYKAFHASPNTIMISTLEDGRILEVNKGTPGVHGFESDDLVDRTTTELNMWADPEDRERFVELLERDGRVREAEFTFLTKAGEKRDCLLSSDVIEVDGERLLVSTSVDITERKRAERELSERLRFESLLSEMSASLLASFAAGAKSGLTDEEQLEGWLRRVLDYVGADQAMIWQRAADNEPAGWLPLAAVAASSFDRGSTCELVELPWARSRLEAGGVARFSSLRELPSQASRDMAALRARGIEGGLLVPMRASEAVVGAMAFWHARRSASWSPALVERVLLVASVLGNSLERKRALNRLEVALDEVRALRDRAEAENVILRKEVRQSHFHGQIIGQSGAIQAMLHQARQVAPMDSTVLILGETGTGKELLARAVHEWSGRQDQPLISINCASIPTSLVESELFGREKGAYTGALSRLVGRFEAAHGGTLFLDEVGELPLEVQAKLLRVLEEGRFQRLGSTKEIAVDVRIIAATNRDLEQAVAEKLFRQDLYYRLNVFPITVPPLRDRIEDVEELLWHFVRELGQRMGKRIEKIPPSDIEALKCHAWPGNIRELRNRVERAMILASGSSLTLSVTDGTTPPRRQRLGQPRRGAAPTHPASAREHGLEGAGPRRRSGRPRRQPLDPRVPNEEARRRAARALTARGFSSNRALEAEPQRPSPSGRAPAAEPPTFPTSSEISGCSLDRSHPSKPPGGS
jgi:formate hydrogenlyase transcriptional activator